MIYDFPDEDAPIRQGDIFFPLPATSIELDNLTVYDAASNSYEVKKWEDLKNEDVSVHLPLTQYWGIVASQDCDAAGRSPAISFFVIKPFSSVIKGEDYAKKTAKSWVRTILKKNADENGKHFYLPEDNRIGFTEKMLASFAHVIQVPSESLITRKALLRKGRLNVVADEHYRESIAQYFRRYPYNEWYPLNKEEFSEYKNNTEEEIKPYPWHE